MWAPSCLAGRGACLTMAGRGDLRHRGSWALACCRGGLGAYAIGSSVRVAGDDRDRVAGDLPRLARVKAGLTQAALGERAGVAQTLISAYENGRRQPSLPALMRLLEAAGFELRMRLEGPDVQARAAHEWGGAA